jgi:Xaa-Pro aminopeptidase
VYARRLERLRDAAECDAMLLYSNGNHSFLEMDPVWYVSGHKVLGEAAVLVRGDRPPRLLFSPAWDRGRVEEESAIADPLATDDLMRDLARWCRQGGLAGEAIGVGGTDKLTARRAAALSDAIGAGWRALDPVLQRAAASRDELELMLAERATRIAEDGYRYALSAVRPGMREYEFGALLDSHMRELGADDNFLLVSASQHNLAVHAPGDRVLERGDIILAEISPSCGGQCTQICRTAVVGTASSAQREQFALLRTAMLAGIAGCRAGARVSDVVGTVDRMVAEAGYERYCRPPYMRTRGHGMGSGSTFPGDLRPDSDVVLEAGMLFVFHPNQYLPESGYLLCGEPIAVETAGGRVLTRDVAVLDQTDGA